MKKFLCLLFAFFVIFGTCFAGGVVLVSNGQFESSSGISKEEDEIEPNATYNLCKFLGAVVVRSEPSTTFYVRGGVNNKAAGTVTATYNSTTYNNQNFTSSYQITTSVMSAQSVTFNVTNVSSGYVFKGWYRVNYDYDEDDPLDYNYGRVSTSTSYSITMYGGGGYDQNNDVGAVFLNTNPETPAAPSRPGFTAYANGGSLSASRSYQIYSISVTNFGYGFKTNSAGWFESQNKGVNNSYSMMKISFSASSNASFTIRYISYAESNYDYAIFSNLDSSLSESYTADTSYYKRTYGESAATEKTVTYSSISSGSHYIYIKFRKDGSGNYYNDSLQLFFESDLSASSGNYQKWQFLGLRYGTLPSASRTGYTFTGWYTAASGGTQITESSIYNGSNIYAHWSINSYTVTFAANGGSGTMSSATWNYDSWYSVANSFSRNGYVFSGWSISTGSTITHYYGSSTSSYSTTSSSTFTDFNTGTRYYKNLRNSSGTVTFTAQWTTKSFTLYLDANGGSSTRTFGVNYGTSSYSNISSYLPTRTGYTFTGFTNSPSGGTYVYDANGAYTGNYVSDWGNYLYSGGTLAFNGTNGQYIYIYAQWTVNTYNVTLNANNGEIYIPLSEWELTGGATYNSSTGEIYLPNIDSRAYSPMIYVGDTFVNSTLSWKSTVEFYTNYSASGDMVTGGASYYNESGVNYSGNGWASKVQVGAWTKTDMVWSNSTDWLGADNCQYIRINFGRSDTYAPNPYYFRNVKFWVLDNNNEKKSGKSVTYGSTYGTLPTPTRENYTFGGWKKGQSKQMYNDFSFAPSTSSAYNHYQFAKCKPGATYHIKIKKAEVTDVQSGYSKPTMFSVLTYDYTASIGYDRQDVYFGQDIELTMTYPSSANPNNDLVLLIYSGIAGSTTGIGTKYSGISIVEETETIVDSSTTYTTAGDEVLFAKWTPVSIKNNVYLRVISKDGRTVSASSNGGNVDVYRYVIPSSGDSYSTETKQTSTSSSYSVHSGKQFYLTAYANSGYEFVGFSKSSSLSDSIKNPSSKPTNTFYEYPTSGTDYYVYFKQLSGNQLQYDEEDKYFYFEDGYYPQSRATNEGTLNSSARTNGESFTYSDGKKNVSIPVYTYGSDRYVKVTKNGTSAWFKFEPIRWRISDYGIAKTERNIAKYTSLYNFRNYTSYATNFTAVSDLILGVGAMHNTRQVDENSKYNGVLSGTWNRDMVGYKFVEETTNGVTLNFNYSASTSQIDVERYGCTEIGEGATVKNCVDDFGYSVAYNSPLRIVSMKELEQVGLVSKQARASDMVAFILGVDNDQVSYWTRDLSNLGAGVAISASGTEIRPWLDQMLGMRFAYTFREGSNAIS